MMASSAVSGFLLTRLKSDMGGYLRASPLGKRLGKMYKPGMGGVVLLAIGAESWAGSGSSNSEFGDELELGESIS